MPRHATHTPRKSRVARVLIDVISEVFDDTPAEHRVNTPTRSQATQRNVREMRRIWLSHNRQPHLLVASTRGSILTFAGAAKFRREYLGGGGSR